MPQEIERKFLVEEGAQWREMASESVAIAQGYLSRRVDATVRVRIKGDKGYITVKGRNDGIRREEYEYEVPLADARQMLSLCEGLVIEKRRWIVPYEGFTWEVDEFAGSLEGLVVAEVELPSVDATPPLPPFVGREVTDDPRYYNSALSPALLGR